MSNKHLVIWFEHGWEDRAIVMWESSAEIGQINSWDGYSAQDSNQESEVQFCSGIQAE